MKRGLILLFAVFMLTACSQTEPTSSHPEPEDVSQVSLLLPQDPPKVEEPFGFAQEPKAGEPSKKEKSTAEGKTVPVLAPTVQSEQVPDTAAELDWAAYAREIFFAITGREEFHAMVWEEDDSCTDVIIQQGYNS